jgi:hypothetical protein
MQIPNSAYGTGEVVMRYLVGLGLVLALVAAPLSASAQEVEEGAALEPSAEEPAPSSEPAPEEPIRGVQRWHPEAFVDPSKPAAEPALQLELDAAGVEVTPKTAPLTTAEQNRLRKRRVRIGVGVALGLVLVGAAIGGGVAAANWEL